MVTVQQVFRVFFQCSVVTLVVAIAAVGLIGYPVYNKSQVDPVETVDAIVVLSGEHDGREVYGIELARQGVSKNLVLPNLYRSVR